ncbi:hypothetical protein [Pseudomonas sp. PLMAX]|uniref:hypothetical protein n=1 Tax=Pseudomonas sp. PLMAX TaxID=2201998 RepID=UPI0038B76CF3
MMIWFLAIAVLWGLWAVSDAIKDVAKEMRRANDRCEAEKAGTTASQPAEPGPKTE